MNLLSRSLEIVQNLVRVLALDNVPLSHLVLEGVLVVILLALLFANKKPKGPRKEKLTKEEEEELIREWQPEPLVNDAITHMCRDTPPLTLDGPVAAHVKVSGVKKLNFGTFDYFGLASDTRVTQSASDAIRKYGVGSCGPRGFYGTIDCHLNLEKELEEFLGSEECVLYSYDFSTVASIVAAYSKRGDVIYYDERISLAALKGILASRSKAVMFRHNDVSHLEEIMKKQEKEDKKDKQKALATRRFLVIEGIYSTTGTVAPLEEYIRLKYKYKTRIILDESHSFGVLGKSGRGLTEHLSVSRSDIDILCGSLSTSLGSVGGFCCGSRFVLDHQRLSSQGYCFSASLPPLNAVAASESLRILGRDTHAREALWENAKLLHEELKGLSKSLTLSGDPLSPLKILIVSDQSKTVEAQLEAVNKVVCVCNEHDVLVAKVACIRTEEPHPLPPSLRVTVSAKHTHTDIKKAAKVIREAAEKVFGK